MSGTIKVCTISNTSVGEYDFGLLPGRVGVADGVGGAVGVGGEGVVALLLAVGAVPDGEGGAEQARAEVVGVQAVHRLVLLGAEAVAGGNSLGVGLRGGGLAALVEHRRQHAHHVAVPVVYIPRVVPVAVTISSLSPHFRQIYKIIS